MGGAGRRGYDLDLLAGRGEREAGLDYDMPCRAVVLDGHGEAAHDTGAMQRAIEPSQAARK